MIKYPITCIDCEKYLGDYYDIENIKADKHVILEDTGHVSEATVECRTCHNEN